MRLESEKYIDEERYCAAYVNDKIRLAKWGKNKVSQGLYMKKIPSEMVRRYLNLIDKEAYLDGLKGLIVTKRKSVRAQTEYELNGKLIRFAISRGFDFCDIKLCMQLPADYDAEDRM
jgi:regulatory protein